MKTRSVTVRLSDEEYEVFALAAIADERSVSEVIRRRALAGAHPAGSKRQEPGSVDRVVQQVPEVRRATEGVVLPQMVQSDPMADYVPEAPALMHCYKHGVLAANAGEKYCKSCKVRLTRGTE